MIIIVSVIVVIAGGVVGTFLFLKGSKASKGPTVLTPAQERALQIDFPQMTTNTSDGGLLQFTVTLQGSDSSTTSEITVLEPQIEDELNNTVHQFSSADLKAPTGQEKLSAIIEQNVNKLLPTGKVTKVLFTQWVVQ